MFADPSIAAVATYEPFMSQAMKNLPARKGQDPDLVEGLSRHHHRHHHRPAGRPRGEPEKYRKFLRGIYKAVDYFKTNPAEFIELAAPHYNLSEAEVKEILDTSLVYTPLTKPRRLSSARRGKPGKLHGIFDTVMELNLENGAADTKLVATHQIDPSVIPGPVLTAKQ